MTRTRQNDRLRNALSLLLCLQQVSGLFRKVGRRSVAAPHDTRHRRRGLEGRAPSGTHRPWAPLPSPRESRPRVSGLWCWRLGRPTPHGQTGRLKRQTLLPPGSGGCGLRPGCQREGAPGSGSGEASGGPHTVPSAVSPRGCGRRAGGSRDTFESTNAQRGPRPPDLICSPPAAAAPSAVRLAQVDSGD